ncbi:phosphoribosylpyrophosphate synthetase [Hymenobacter sediminis]|uniref:phosphoribosylpyrophosphate synthetase n=1 Tax=Hymenobacter sediminis TaxID=2218621 RepID=UPI000DA672FF|nr:phosphoribosylpyrophosphate synthetase [Hymenobacter sediminis]RPD44890.1 phosphoribosylpyrophosphate synthetase [Hymenobacter sediminis]
MPNSMQVNRFDTYLDALAYLHAQGYTHSFQADGRSIRCTETGRLYSPLDLLIVCFHRFEGDKDMGDVSVLYVVETTDGAKGTILDGYGAYADADLAVLLRMAPMSARTKGQGLTVGAE